LSQIIFGNCLKVLAQFEDESFSAGCFSPPYGVGADCGFDVRRDFALGGGFLPYAWEISRVCRVWAINLSQRVHNGRNLPYLEQFVTAMEELGVELFDRWVIVKPSGMPQRGQRPQTRFEFVLLFSMYRSSVKMRRNCGGSTVISVSHHSQNNWHGKGEHWFEQGAVKLTPYYPEIPQQVFALYGGPEPVLDPFAGSGTTLRVARVQSLEFVGIELDRAVHKQLVRDMNVLL